jgi:DNA-directed RNA polymerase subunit RPC12/RpoP
LFSRNDHLKRHVATVHKEALGIKTQAFKCQPCKRSFSTRDHLVRHQKKNHITEQGSKTTTNTLAANLTEPFDPLSLLTPELLDVFSYICPHSKCSQSFVKRRNWQRHIRSQHATDDAPSCPICSTRVPIKRWEKHRRLCTSLDDEVHVERNDALDDAFVFPDLKRIGIPREDNE